MRLRLPLGIAGVLLALFGVFRLVTQVPPFPLVILALWLVGALVIHDGILSPVPEEQADAMARRAEERLISEQDGPPPRRRQRDVTTTTKRAAHRQRVENLKLRHLSPPDPAIGR